MTVQVLVYPVLIVLVGGFALLTVPREDLRLLLPYGVVLGGLYDYIHGVITGDLLKIGTFQNQHIFAVGDHLILTPIAWTFIMVLYLYYWPQRNKYIGWLYLLSWALLATGTAKWCAAQASSPIYLGSIPSPCFSFSSSASPLPLGWPSAPTFYSRLPAPQFVHKWKEPHLILEKSDAEATYFLMGWN